jgi:hypothetical protein
LLQYRQRLTTDVEAQKKVNDADRELARAILAVEQDKYKLVTTDYQQQVAALTTKVTVLETEARNPPWYHSVWFGAALGIVTTGALVGLGAAVTRR